MEILPDHDVEHDSTLETQGSQASAEQPCDRDQTLAVQASDDQPLRVSAFGPDSNGNFDL